MSYPAHIKNSGLSIIISSFGTKTLDASYVSLFRRVREACSEGQVELVLNIGTAHKFDGGIRASIEALENERFQVSIHSREKNLMELAIHDTILVINDEPQYLPSIAWAVLHSTLPRGDITSISLFRRAVTAESDATKIVRATRPSLLAQLRAILQLRSFANPSAKSLLLNRNTVRRLPKGKLYKNLLSIVSKNPKLSVAEIPILVAPELYASDGEIDQQSPTATPSYTQSVLDNHELHSFVHKPLKLNKLLLLVAVTILGYSFAMQPQLTIVTLLTTSGILLFFQASVELYRMIYAFRNPDAIDNLKFPDPSLTTKREKFCIFVPARHEAAVIANTLQQLAQQTYRDLDIITVICDDDEETIAAARTVTDTHDRVRIIEYPLPAGAKPNKPKQLNYAFEHMRDSDYTVFGVIDAEDSVHPDLIENINASFSGSDADIVQGGVQLMNYDTSWYSLHNVLEYYRWFNSGMTFHAAMGFIPLGGNTVFVRSQLLRATNGWPNTLTEDCSLGVLLSSQYQAKVAVHYEPELATREETPDSIRGLFKQRVRWNQGFYHEWKKNVWAHLPTAKQRLIADYVLIGPVLMAAISVILILSLIAALTVDASVGVVMVMYISLIPGILMVAMNAMYLHDFGKAFKRHIKIRQYFVLIATQFFYQAVLNAAAFWAVVREIRGDNTWHKTPHKGLHRQQNPNMNMQQSEIQT